MILEAIPNQVDSLVAKWVWLEAKYRDAASAVIEDPNWDCDWSDVEYRNLLRDRAAQDQRDFGNAVRLIFGEAMLEQIASKGMKKINALIKAA